MATTVIQASGMGVLERPRLSALQRYYVRRSHPASLFIEAAGLGWVVYFFWNHLWAEALLVLVFSRLIANVVSFRANIDALVQTGVGQIALLHIQPINWFVQLVGVVALFYGIWTHEAKMILAGLSVLFLGHLIGWHRVDRHFELS
jgi:hypothetical protein